QREVYIDGEAFFEVTPMADQPFIVHTAVQDEVVMGTSFNVYAYKEDRSEATTQVTGKLRVVGCGDSRGAVRATLSPGQPAVLEYLRVTARPVRSNPAGHRQGTGRRQWEQRRCGPRHTFAGAAGRR